MDEHPMAVRHDLLKYGFRLEQVGFSLAWCDAFAILSEQPPETSAVYRALYPDLYNKTRVVDRLEKIGMLIFRGQLLLGKQSDINDADLPSTWDEIFVPPEKQEEVETLTFEEIDARMGWMNQHPDTVQLWTTEEIDQKMGW